MKLIKPDKKYADSYYRAVEGYKENNIRLYEFFDMPFEKIVKYTDDMEKGENLQELGSCYLSLVCRRTGIFGRNQYTP